MNNHNIKEEDSKQAVIVDYKALGCKSPGGGHNAKPLIQYSLEWLLIEQFDEVFVCCLPDNVQQIRDFVKQFSETENVPSSMTIAVHSSENNRSTGDCLRDLDSKALIKSDFVIMDVGCCGNLPLADMLYDHKNLKKQDKNAILTTVVRNLFIKNPAEIGEFPIYITNPNPNPASDQKPCVKVTSKQNLKLNTESNSERTLKPKSGLLLHYVAGRVAESEKPGPVQACAPYKSVVVPSEIFLDLESVKIHTNLSSTNLSIYSNNVPALFTELFDCHSEADLIQATFDNHEVLGGTVYVHIVDDLFSQRMADFGFAINQKRDKFDTNLIYKRNERCQVLRKLVNDSLIDCTRLNSADYLENLNGEDSSESESESDSEESIMDDEEAFLCEVLDSLVRGYEETIKNENLVLEINSSKHAYNISIKDVYSTLARALLLLPEKLTCTKPKNSTEYYRIVENSILKFKQFLLNYVKNHESRATFITTMADLSVSNEIQFFNDSVLAKVLYKLYEVDALDEESVLRWFHEFDESDELQKELRSKPVLKKLVEALEADSDEE